MKRRIVELMVVNKKEGTTSNRESKRHIIGFKDSEKLDGITSDIFTLVIMETLVNFYVSKIIIDYKISYDIMYVKLFETLELKKEKLWPYEGSNRQDLIDTITHQ